MTKSHDKGGKEWAKLSELKPGDKILLDSGFTCAAGTHTVHCDDDEGLFFRCAHGRHYLSGQADDGDHCVGVYRWKKKALKLPPISKGNKRAFVKCRDCGNPAYYDYLPHSLSNPIMTMPCGHGLTERFHEVAKSITKEEFLRLSRI